MLLQCDVGKFLHGVCFVNGSWSQVTWQRRQARAAESVSNGRFCGELVLVHRARMERKEALDIPAM